MYTIFRYTKDDLVRLIKKDINSRFEFISSVLDADISFCHYDDVRNIEVEINGDFSLKKKSLGV